MFVNKLKETNRDDTGRKIFRFAIVDMRNLQPLGTTKWHYNVNRALDEADSIQAKFTIARLTS